MRCNWAQYVLESNYVSSLDVSHSNSYKNGSDHIRDIDDTWSFFSKKKVARNNAFFNIIERDYKHNRVGHGTATNIIHVMHEIVY